MTETIPAHEPAIRLGFFLGVLACMALWETLSPRRVRDFPRRVRWPNNLGIVAVDALLLRIVFPTLAVGLALLAAQRDWGLLNNFTLPYSLAVILSVILLDLVIYLQHVLFHAVPVLWRLHRMHHADLEFDLTTGLRFHPGEIFFIQLMLLSGFVGIGLHSQKIR